MHLDVAPHLPHNAAGEDEATFDQLARVVALWGRLGPSMRAAVVATVEAAAGGVPGEE